MFHCTDDTPVCRGCGRHLEGSPYFKGGRAFVPAPEGAPSWKREPAKKNHFGGWVCSYDCDRRASLEQERSMPGHDWEQRTLSCYAADALRRNWPAA